METLQLLSRSEMKEIKAGYMQESCRLYDSEGGWGACDWNLTDAKSFYNNDPHTTGYCCTSCGTGNFSNAEPC